MEFTNRQILITRIYASKRWAMGAAAHLGYCAHADLRGHGDRRRDTGRRSVDTTGAVRVRNAAARGHEGGRCAPWRWKNSCRNGRARSRKWNWVWTTLAPVVPFLFAWNFIASLLTKRTRWRGVQYELVSVASTHVLRP